MEKYTSIRKTMYNERYIELGNFINIKSPYTMVKTIYYIETSSFFLFATQKFVRSPNFVTFLYIFSGIIGAFLLNSTQKEIFCFGVFLVFTKGTFDWSDGPLARRLNKTSYIGHVLDTYGAYVSDSAFRICFVYYTFSYFPNFIDLFPIFAFILLITKFNVFCDYMSYKNSPSMSSNKHQNKQFISKIKNPQNATGFAKWYYKYQCLLDARARSIDFLLLILIIDNFLNYNTKYLLMCLSILLIFRALVIFSAGIYYTFQIYKYK